MKAIMRDKLAQVEPEAASEAAIYAEKLRLAAARALAEAEARRKAPPNAAVEVNGRGGLEPVRYGDWEVKGLASDF